MFGNDGTKTGINRFLQIAGVFIFLTMSEAFHQTFFNSLQEIEHVHIVHRMRQRPRRELARGSLSIPYIIKTEIQRDKQKIFLTFRRKRDTVLSPVFTLNKEFKRLVNETITRSCAHYYDDIDNSAHAVVSRCDDTVTMEMIAEVVLGNELHVILPKGSRNADLSSEHGLFKVNNTNNFANDYKKLSALSKEKSLPNLNHRFRRQTERNTVELMFVVDYSLYQFWYRLTTGTANERVEATLSLIQRMYAFISNGIHLRYESLQTSYDVNIDVELTSIYVLKTAEESAFTENENVNFASTKRGVVDAEKLLDSFKSWIDDQKHTNPTIFLNNDHYMLFTAREVVLAGNAAASGFAYYSTICTPESVSIVEDKFNFLSIATAAHELGHSLGGVHDGELNDAGCKDEDGYILSAINSVHRGSITTHPWKFSPCSANAFATTLRRLQESTTNCLRNDDQALVLLPSGRPPGQMYPPDQQCKLMLDSESVMWRQSHVGAFDRMCTAMACTQQGYTKLLFVIPGDGTTCGDKKWCWNGKCVFSDEAPSVADESCLHGDQMGTVVEGATCDDTFTDDSSKWKCYQKNIRETCCATCNNKLTRIEGCEYGDKNDCTAISSSGCYKPDVEKYCCETCFNKAQPFLNLPSDCKYGDKKTNCVRSPSTCEQFFSDCCATCNGYSTLSASTTTSSTTRQATVKSTEKSGSTGSTRTDQEPRTEAPEKQEDGLPKWVIPVAGGVGGVIGLAVLLGLCYYCMKGKSGDKYMEKEERRRSDRSHRRKSKDSRRKSEDNRRKSEDNRKKSEDNRRKSEDNRRMSEDNKRRPKDYNRSRSHDAAPPPEGGRRNMRRSSEGVRSTPRHNARRGSEVPGRNEYQPSFGYNDRQRY